MFAADIDLEFAGDPGDATGLRPRPIRLGPDEIDGDRQGNLPHDVGDEDEGPRGDPDDDYRSQGPLEVVGDLGGELGDAAADLLPRPQDPLDIGIDTHGRERGTTEDSGSRESLGFIMFKSRYARTARIGNNKREKYRATTRDES